MLVVVRAVGAVKNQWAVLRVTSRSWAEITRCVGPWDGPGRRDLNYDLGVLGAGYDPYNVLTCVCTRCGERWSYDSPTSECRLCERETLIEYLVDENRRLEKRPPRHRKPPRRPKYKFVMEPSFVQSMAALTGESEVEIRAKQRERGVHMAHAEPVEDEDTDPERDALLRFVANERIDWLKLTEDRRGEWIAWWATREDHEPAEVATSRDRKARLRVVPGAWF